MAVFYPVSETQITKAIVTSFSQELIDCIVSDVIIVGAGPSGLMAARRLAQHGRKVVLIEGNNFPGGGFWMGGYLMNKVTFRSPSEKLLQELNIPYSEAAPGLVVADAPHACAKLIAAACDAGVKILNMTRCEDLVLKKARVTGVVINWMPVVTLPKQVAALDPVCLETKVVIDATGHDANVVAALQSRGLVEIVGCGAMDVERSEELVLEKTTMVYPGLIVTGMAAAATYGLPRMGPTFGSMFLSGEKAAELAQELLVESAKR